jgi:membrane protein YqaA with SNARE-associated domain
MLIQIVAFVLGCAVGYALGRWIRRRPRKVKQEDRNAGLARYQAVKNG